MAQNITEDVVDFVKIGLAATPPAASYFLGFSLQEWMYIASIVASIFIVLDKVPRIIASTYNYLKEKYATRKNQSNDCSPCCATDNSP